MFPSYKNALLFLPITGGGILIFILFAGLRIEVNTPLKMGTILSESGYEYKTVRIGGKIWLAENLREDVLNVEKYRVSKCYSDDESYCSRYGMLYNLAGAKYACQRLGTEWRLPSRSDWKSMTDAFGNEDSYEQRRSLYSELSNSANGFVIRHGGYCSFEETRYDCTGTCYYRHTCPSRFGAYWTSSTSKNSQSKALSYIFYRGHSLLKVETNHKQDLLSCRCVKD